MRTHTDDLLLAGFGSVRARDSRETGDLWQKRNDWQLLRDAVLSCPWALFHSSSVFSLFFFFFFYINQSQALTRALTQRCGSRRGSLAWNTHHTGQGQRQSEREKERQRVKVLECRTGRTIAVLTSIRFI